MTHSECLSNEIKILDDVICLSVGPGDARYHSDEYADILQKLEDRLRHSYFLSRARLIGINLPPWPNKYIVKPNTEIIPPEESLYRSRMHLFLAATWIYFERTARHLVGESETLSRLLDDAFSLLSYHLQNEHVEFKIRHQPFALFVIGGEARSDRERKLVLDVLARASVDIERLSANGQPCLAIGVRASGLGYAMKLTKRLWIKYDLHDHSEGYLDYSTKLHEVISSCEKLPSLL